MSQASLQDPFTTIELDAPVHFLAADGSDVTVPPGTYEVESAEEWIRLLLGERRDAVLIEADRRTHPLDIAFPLAMAFSGDSTEEADLHFVMLLLPGGQSLEATATYSGIRQRGGFNVGQALNNAKKTATSAYNQAQSTANQAASTAGQAAQQAAQQGQQAAQPAAAIAQKGMQGAQAAAMQAKQAVEKNGQPSQQSRHRWGWAMYLVEPSSKCRCAFGGIGLVESHVYRSEPLSGAGNRRHWKTRCLEKPVFVQRCHWQGVNGSGSVHDHSRGVG